MSVDLCKNGHELKGSNIAFSCVKGNLYVRCKRCAAEKVMARRRAQGQKPKLQNIEDRFWNMVIKKNSGCWDWTGCFNNMGYARFSETYSGKGLLAHRYSYILHKGEIPQGYEIDHLCFNPRCVNPEHLEAVTPSINVQRAWNRRKQKTN